MFTVIAEGYTLRSFVLAAAVFLSPLSAGAQTVWQRCDNCSQSQAAAMAAPGTAPAYRGVFNLGQGWWEKFEVYSEGVGPGCIERRPASGKDDKSANGADSIGQCHYQNVAYSIPFDSPEVEYFQALRDLYLATSGTLKEQFDVDASELGLPSCPASECVSAVTTAYDVERNFGVSQRVRQFARDALASRSLALRVVDRAIAIANAQIWGVDGSIVVIVVRFTGGSFVVIAFTEATPQGVVTGAFDPNGNPVWGNAGDAREGSGEFTYHFNVEDFLEHARRIGIPIGGPLGSNTTTRYTCRNDGRNGVVCRRGTSGS